MMASLRKCLSRFPLMDILCWVSFTVLPSILCPPCCVFLVSGQCPWVSFAALPSENCWLGVFLKDTLLVSHPPYNVPPCCVSPVSGQCPLVSLGVPGWCSPLNQCNHTNSPTGRTLTLRCTLLTMMQFAGNDSPFWLVLYQQSLFSSNPDFVISEVLHNFCSSSSSITFFSICSQKFGRSLKSPPLAPPGIFPVWNSTSTVEIFSVVILILISEENLYQQNAGWGPDSWTKWMFICSL